MTQSRRRFLSSLGLAVAAPALLRPLGVHAASDAPKRVVFFLTPNGTEMDAFWEGDATNLGRILAPLEPIADKVLRIRGIDNEAANEPEIPPNHQPDWNTALTGVQALPGTRRARGISVDQHIANALAGETTYKSLHFGAKPHGGGSEVPLWAGPDARVQSEDDPYRMFDRLFADFSRPPSVVEQTRRQRRSVLDAVRAQAQAVQCRISSEYREGFEAHLSSIRSLEQRLAQPTTATCSPSSVPTGLDLSSDDDVPEVGRAQMDMLRMSLACDLTRVATFQYGKSASQIRPRWLGIDRGLHSLNHGSGDSDAEWSANIIAVENWFAQEFAYLAMGLDAIPEGDGTLLDHTLLVWVHEQAIGRRHVRRDMPYVIAGGGVHGIRGGRKKAFDGEPHNQFLVALCHAMGVDLDRDTFGNPDYRGVIDLS